MSNREYFVAYKMNKEIDRLEVIIDRLKRERLIFRLFLAAWIVAGSSLFVFIWK